MPVNALNQQNTPSVRDIFPKYSDLTKNTKQILEENLNKAKQDVFQKKNTEELTYSNNIKNLIKRTNEINNQRETTPRETVREAQKVTNGLFNAKELTNQKNVLNEMQTQTKELPRIKRNDEITNI
ncbi:MAG TPA: hypothetical protein PKW14_06110 [Bacteroidota bacterium]|jgi:TRAP-type mannitol/chloroaromatic compound transport system substrate-binding protein|nr:hypothetical protein [Bacteroidota bacterium]